MNDNWLIHERHSLMKQSRATADSQIKRSLMQFSKSVWGAFWAMLLNGPAIAASMDIAGVKVGNGAMVAATLMSKMMPPWY